MHSDNRMGFPESGAIERGPRWGFVGFPQKETTARVLYLQPKVSVLLIRAPVSARPAYEEGYKMMSIRRVLAVTCVAIASIAGLGCSGPQGCGRGRPAWCFGSGRRRDRRLGPPGDSWRPSYDRELLDNRGHVLTQRHPESLRLDGDRRHRWHSGRQGLPNRDHGGVERRIHLVCGHRAVRHCGWPDNLCASAP